MRSPQRPRDTEGSPRKSTRMVGAYLLRISILSLCLCVSAVQTALSQGLPVARPEAVGMSAEKLALIDDLVNQDIRDKKLPGAVVLIGHRGKIVFRKAYGNRSLVPTAEPMTLDTIFDLASLTKVVATTTSVMLLVEQGKLRLSDTIGRFIPDIKDEQAKRITVQQLMTHVSGYAPDFDLKEKWAGRDGMLQALYKEKLRNAPGVRFAYSDINYIVLAEIIQRISGQSVADFSLDRVFRPAGMPTTMFRPINALNLPSPAIVAPTENIKGQNSYLGASFEGDEAMGNQILRGVVHDPTAFRMNGVAGHAGLFSTADDLARFCQMLLNGGVVPRGEGGSGSEGAGESRGRQKGTLPTGRVSASSRRILSTQTVSRMTSPNVVSETGDARGLGWDLNTSFSANRGELFPLGSFGHTGFTGTGLWVDRVSQTFLVFLSNRVHPDGKGDVSPLRAKVATVIASAVEDTPIEKYRQAEAEFNATVAAQLPRFIRGSTAITQTQTVPLPATSSIPLIVDGPGVAHTVLNGIDVLARGGFKDLEGKRVGLVTNHTGRDLTGRPTIDVLFEAKSVKLVSLFAPEHGIRGELDVSKIDDSKDEKTGLPIYSLYGETRRPKPEQLKDLEAIVYDIQDIGTRFYTYTATLRNVMEEAAKAKVPVYVLDRPNPLGGNAVEGPVADEDKLSFIAAHTTPVRYGLTIGELGMLMNAERKIGADLRVVKMDGWARSMWFDETDQTWVNPSPNMRSLNEATLYPGIGLLETTNVSVGRGTDTPFEILGAPYIDGRRLASYLNARGLPGIRFVPITFTPNASVFKDQKLGGINMIITDRNSFRSVRTGIEIAAALRKLYTSQWEVDKYARLLVNGNILEMLKRGDSPEKIELAIEPQIADFKTRRAPYLLYK